MTFKEELSITIIDKVVIGLIVTGIGFWLSIQLETFKTKQDLKNQVQKEQREFQHQLETEQRDFQAQLAKEQREAQSELEREQREFRTRLAEEQAKDRDVRRLNFLEHQLSTFYWPLFLRLERDNAIWEKMHEKWTGGPAERRIGEQLEGTVILPNHDEIVKLIESNVYTAKPDGDLLEQMKKYLRHVAIYKALRATGNKEDPSKLGEPFPKEFFSLVQKRLSELQKQYDSAVAANDRLAPNNPAR